MDNSRSTTGKWLSILFTACIMAPMFFRHVMGLDVGMDVRGVVWLLCAFVTLTNWTRMSYWLKGVMSGMAAQAFGVAIVYPLGAGLYAELAPEKIEQFYTAYLFFASPGYWYYLTFVVKADSAPISMFDQQLFYLSGYLYPIVAGGLIGAWLQVQRGRRPGRTNI